MRLIRLSTVRNWPSRMYNQFLPPAYDLEPPSRVSNRISLEILVRIFDGFVPSHELHRSLCRVDRTWRLAATWVLRQRFQGVYSALIRAPRYCSDPFRQRDPTLMAPTSSSALNSDHQKPSRESEVLDRFISYVLTDLQPVSLDRHLYNPSCNTPHFLSWTHQEIVHSDFNYHHIFDYLQPQARGEDLLIQQLKLQGLILTEHQITHHSSVLLEDDIHIKFTSNSIYFKLSNVFILTGNQSSSTDIDLNSRLERSQSIAEVPRQRSHTLIYSITQLGQIVHRILLSQQLILVMGPSELPQTHPFSYHYVFLKQ
ncbi:hypothetical protein CROQUDRAFT_659562 [Cronartium quercuum f. sp. fusiforme G11]|uniref:Uncharacterized protein n=1 Tax=Cronartium quercuum f. sp. fusiforme G11 TaxID=708437 RepID=A0A9P6NDJ3_9BASI|nr:hypothetical protein CROQUDRAFT_659562 [Cronartium quercuum f. sp. fusiforme G11]